MRPKTCSHLIDHPKEGRLGNVLRAMTLLPTRNAAASKAARLVFAEGSGPTQTIYDIEGVGVPSASESLPLLCNAP